MRPRKGRPDIVGKRQLTAALTMLDDESANVIKLVRSGICQPDDPQVAIELSIAACDKCETKLCSGEGHPSK